MFTVQYNNKKNEPCKAKFIFNIFPITYKSVIKCLKDAKILKDGQSVSIKNPYQKTLEGRLVKCGGYFGFYHETLGDTLQGGDYKINLKIVKERSFPPQFLKMKNNKSI